MINIGSSPLETITSNTCLRERIKDNKVHSINVRYKGVDALFRIEPSLLDWKARMRPLCRTKRSPWLLKFATSFISFFYFLRIQVFHNLDDIGIQTHNAGLKGKRTDHNTTSIKESAQYIKNIFKFLSVAHILKQIKPFSVTLKNRT